MDLSLNYTSQQIVAFLAAVILGIIGYFIAQTFNFESSTASIISNMTDKDTRSSLDKFGDNLMERLGLSWKTWENNLMMAQLVGKFTNYTVGGILGRAILYGGIAIIYLFVFQPPAMFYLVALLLIYFPFMRVKGAADEARKEVVRLLPETATIIAAEMAAGADVEKALGRAAEIPGPLGTLLHRALTISLSSHRPAFTRGTVQGVVMEILDGMKIQQLTRFGIQMDRIAVKGVDGPRIMADVARGFAREYKTAVQSSAASLDTKLLMPMALFFFLPFMAAILLPLFISLLKVF
jgi:Flp pilus assembly protein TadB